MNTDFSGAAQFIVTACNSYEAREALVKDLAETAEDLLGIARNEDLIDDEEYAQICKLISKAKGDA